MLLGYDVLLPPYNPIPKSVHAKTSEFLARSWRRARLWSPGKPSCSISLYRLRSDFSAIGGDPAHTSTPQEVYCRFMVGEITLASQIARTTVRCFGTTDSSPALTSVMVNLPTLAMMVPLSLHVAKSTPLVLPPTCLHKLDHSP